MAQYFWDFSDQAVDGAAPDGFTQRGDVKTAPNGYIVSTGPTVTWQSDGATNGYSLLTPDVIGDVSGDQEIYIEWESSATGGNVGGVALRIQTTNPGDNNYWVVFGSAGAEIIGGRIVAGTEDWNTLTQSWSTATVYAMRAKVASNVVSWRVFTPGGAEGSYTTYTDGGSNFSSGRPGLLARGFSGVRTFRKFGVGTAGDAAPTAPVGGGGDTLVVVGNPQRNRRTSGRRM